MRCLVRALALRLPIALIVFSLASCGPAAVDYHNGVRPAKAGEEHPWLSELKPLLIKPPQGQTDDQLMQVWTEFLGHHSLPLSQGNRYTFVFYDFSHTKNQVYLEASFAPSRLLPLQRLKTTGLFWGTWQIPRPTKEQYRFSDGSSLLPDPFNPAVELGNQGWHKLIDTDSSDCSFQKIVGAAHSDLQGMDLEVLLPPGYADNLASTYPVQVLLGDKDENWTKPWTGLMESGKVKPLIVVSISSAVAASRTSATELQIALPWIKNNYRVSTVPTDITLIDWTREQAPAHDAGVSVWTPALAQEDLKVKELITWLRNNYPPPPSSNP